MDQKDVNQIQDLFNQSFAKVWEDNVEPALSEMSKQIGQLPTKAYLDDKLANLEGGLVAKLRKEDEKVNRLAEMLKQKKILTDSDLTELGQLQVFPK